MEVIKTLPDIFEEFSEQRRNSFLHAYEIKQKNIPFVGTFCTYTPTEVIMAAGAIPVGLCSFSDETIPEAEQDLPRNLCPLVKSSYGFAKTQKCPFFYFSDLIIGETTCDGKKKMYEMLGEIKDTYIMELPNRQSPMGRKLWREEVVALKNKLEEKFGVEITEEKLREQVHLSNQNRLALRHFYELMKLDPPPMGQPVTRMRGRFSTGRLPCSYSVLMRSVRALTSSMAWRRLNLKLEPYSTAYRLEPAIGGGSSFISS